MSYLACGIFGERMREQFKTQQRADSMLSCPLPTEWQDAIELRAQDAPAGAASRVGREHRHVFSSRSLTQWWFRQTARAAPPTRTNSSAPLPEYGPLLTRGTR
jgi:hypothetical protein